MNWQATIAILNDAIKQNRSCAGHLEQLLQSTINDVIYQGGPLASVLELPGILHCDEGSAATYFDFVVAGGNEVITDGVDGPQSKLPHPQEKKSN